MIEPVKTRLERNVPRLKERVEGAGAFAAVINSGSKPSSPVMAYVLYGGMTGLGKPDVMAGAYRQEVRESINIVLMVRSTDSDGRKALDDVKGLQQDILNCLCGWAPADQIGQFSLVRAATVQFAKGLLIYQIELTITDQLRIMS